MAENGMEIVESDVEAFVVDYTDKKDFLVRLRRERVFVFGVGHWKAGRIEGIGRLERNFE